MTIYISGRIFSILSWMAPNPASSSWFRTIFSVRPGIFGCPLHDHCWRGLLRLLCCRALQDFTQEFRVPPPGAPRGKYKSVASVVTFDDSHLLVPSVIGMVFDQDCCARREGLPWAGRLFVMGFALCGCPCSSFVCSLRRQLPQGVERSPVCLDMRMKWVSEDSLGR